MRIQLSDHFTYRKIIRFVIPSILMMIFTSCYSIVDGLFISNFVGTTAFAAVNLIYPVVMVVSGFGFVIGTGGSAVVAITMGEGQEKEANQYFSLLICFSILIGVLGCGIGQLVLRPVAILLGASGQLLSDCLVYCRIILAAVPCFMLQVAFHTFFSTAEKPKYGLYMTVGAGIINVVLDFVFVGVLKWGLAGAAIATAISQMFGGLAPVYYFLRANNSSRLRIVKPIFRMWVLTKTVTNGISEFLSSISSSFILLLYNHQLMVYAGTDGVAAYGVIEYVFFIFFSVFSGYAMGSAPVISFHYGAQNTEELQNLFKKSLKLIMTASVTMLALSQVFARPLSAIFVSYDADLLDMTVRGFRIYAGCYLMCGMGVFGSSFFTALGNGLISAIISFFRTVVFDASAVMLLPLIWGLDGVWAATIVSEGLALILTVWFEVTQNKKYHYWK